MGREIRLVAKDWVHPKRANGNLIAMNDGADLKRFKEWHDADLKSELAEFVPVENPKYENEFRCFEDYCEATGFVAEFDESRFMPEWSEAEKTHIMLYENVSEGTSMSPAFLATEPEKLAQWLADNNANAGAYSTATYEQWLCMINKGYAVSGVMLSGTNKIISGVEASCQM